MHDISRQHDIARFLQRDEQRPYGRATIKLLGTLAEQILFALDHLRLALGTVTAIADLKCCG
jgi:GAF domain-containing protein